MANYQLREDIPKKVEEALSKYPKIVQKLLFHRGILSEVEAEKFFNPDYEHDTFSPSLLKDIEKAAKRILKAVEENQKVLIYSDYDCDGIPGAVILHDFFKKINFNNFTNYIPHRNDEGFGLNLDAINKAANDGVNLIITIDCGISDAKEVSEARRLGIDLIITDHHLPNGEVPEAYAILNPNQEGDEYPCKYLCGSGVVFKLVQSLINTHNFSIKEGWDKWLLDMVGLATIADMVPLLEENRTLAHYGLLVLRKSPRPGLQNLYREANLNQKYLNEDDISFVLAPRINAASRMDETIVAFNLLKSFDEVESKEAALRLIELNNKRKVLTAQIVKDIKKKLSKNSEIPPVIVAGNSNWAPSILGLVAGNLAEEFKRPVFLWGANGGREIRGSCRSDGVSDVFTAMQKKSELFLHFGGHKFSGGFGILKEKLILLEKEMLGYFKDIKNYTEEKPIFVDESLSVEDIDEALMQNLKKFAPFGVGNQKPLFLIKSVKIPSIQKFGKENSHLKLEFERFDRKPISAISFFSNEKSFSKKLTEGEMADLIVNLEESYFRSRPELRLRIIDII